MVLQLLATTALSAPTANDGFTIPVGTVYKTPIAVATPVPEPNDAVAIDFSSTSERRNFFDDFTSKAKETADVTDAYCAPWGPDQAQWIPINSTKEQAGFADGVNHLCIMFYSDLMHQMAENDTDTLQQNLMTNTITSTPFGDLKVVNPKAGDSKSGISRKPIYLSDGGPGSLTCKSF